jgi:hypothetical protein
LAAVLRRLRAGAQPSGGRGRTAALACDAESVGGSALPLPLNRGDRRVWIITDRVLARWQLRAGSAKSVNRGDLEGRHAVCVLGADATSRGYARSAGRTRRGPRSGRLRAGGCACTPSSAGPASTRPDHRGRRREH